MDCALKKTHAILQNTNTISHAKNCPIFFCFIFLIGISRWVLIYLSLLIGILILIDIVWYKYDVIALLGRSNILVRWSCYIIIALLVVLFSQKGVATEFVYFQF